jgi:hypothetical protein
MDVALETGMDAVKWFYKGEMLIWQKLNIAYGARWLMFKDCYAPRRFPRPRE